MTEAEQDRLINEHMHLVQRIAAEFRGQIDFDDLKGIGAIGLTKAARSYDGELSKFSTWAVTKIRGEMSDAVRSGKYDLSDNFPPLIESDSLEKIYEWDAWGEIGNAMAIAETWEQLDAPGDLAEQYIDIKDKAARFQAAFISLTGNQRKLVKWVYLNNRPLSIPDAARELGCSRFQAGRMLKKALKTMREVITRMESNENKKSSRGTSGGIANGLPSILGLHGCVPGVV